MRVPGNAISGRDPRRRTPAGSSRTRFGSASGARRRRAPAVARSPPTGPSAFDGSGMWIWYLSKSHGGDPAAIAAQAQAHGVSTVFVKSADGTNVWSQFSATAVAALKATGLRVCGWQFVYGRQPDRRGVAAAAAAKDAGADCFVIDAETAYEGRYAQAQRYVAEAARAGRPRLSDRPHVVPVRRLPPGPALQRLHGARRRDVQPAAGLLEDDRRHGRRVARAHLPVEPAVRDGDLPARPDLRRAARRRRPPLPPAVDRLRRARRELVGVAVRDRLRLGRARRAGRRRRQTPPTLWPTLRARTDGRVGSRGDLVVWAQQHLLGAGQAGRPSTARSAPARPTRCAASRRTSSLPVTGEVDAATWPALLKVDAGAGRLGRAGASAPPAARAPRRRVAGGLPPGPNGPASAALPAKRYEIPGGPRR